MTRRRGFTVLEVTIALSVVTVLAGTALGGVRAHQVSVARAWTRLAASRAASSRLEVLRGLHLPLRVGTKRFSPAPAGTKGVERVLEIEPGLFEVTVEVEHEADGVRVRLVTLVGGEAAP